MDPTFRLLTTAIAAVVAAVFTSLAYRTGNLISAGVVGAAALVIAINLVHEFRLLRYRWKGDSAPDPHPPGRQLERFVPARRISKLNTPLMMDLRGAQSNSIKGSLDNLESTYRTLANWCNSKGSDSHTQTRPKE